MHMLISIKCEAIDCPFSIRNAMGHQLQIDEKPKNHHGWLGKVQCNHRSGHSNVFRLHSCKFISNFYVLGRLAYLIRSKQFISLSKYNHKEKRTRKPKSSFSSSKNHASNSQVIARLKLPMCSPIIKLPFSVRLPILIFCNNLSSHNTRDKIRRSLVGARTSSLKSALRQSFLWEQSAWNLSICPKILRSQMWAPPPAITDSFVFRRLLTSFCMWWERPTRGGRSLRMVENKFILILRSLYKYAKMKALWGGKEFGRMLSESVCPHDLCDWFAGRDEPVLWIINIHLR